MGTSKSFAELAGKMALAADNIRASRAASFRQAERDIKPRFRAEAQNAAGGDRSLSHHRSKAKLDANFKIIDGTTTTLLFISPVGPWGIRDSTDTSGKTKTHVIQAKNVNFLRFEDQGGELIYRSRVVHRGSAREPYWGRARTLAVDYIRKRIPQDTIDAINAALSGSMYKSRS